MATFISTVTFSDAGMRDIRETCRRAKAFRERAAKAGVEVQCLLWTQGPFDGLIVFQAPDEETATALMLALGSAGNVHTQTARAYDAAEMEQILGKLPG